MLVNIFSLIFVANGLWCTSLKSDKSVKLHYAHKAEMSPILELPCKLFGGTCAKSNACPRGTRVGDLGLCPEQQEYGLECCRSLKEETKCKARNGVCIPRGLTCSKHLRVRDVTDCKLEEICCMSPAHYDE